MLCQECIYGKEDFERRMYQYYQTIKERGIPNNIYHYLQPEDAPSQFEQFLWCDKVGGKVYCFGHCSDYDDFSVIPIKLNKSKQKRRTKRERDKKYKNHLKQLYGSSNTYSSPVRRVDKVYDEDQHSYIPLDHPYYTRQYRRHYSKYLKRQSNKKIRRYKGELHNGNMCHKLYDYWWDLY